MQFLGPARGRGGHGRRVGRAGAGRSGQFGGGGKLEAFLQQVPRALCMEHLGDADGFMLGRCSARERRGWWCLAGALAPSRGTPHRRWRRLKSASRPRNSHRSVRRRRLRATLSLRVSSDVRRLFSLRARKWPGVLPE